MFENFGTGEILISLAGLLATGTAGTGVYKGFQWWRKPTASSVKAAIVADLHNAHSVGILIDREMSVNSLLAACDEKSIWEPIQGTRNGSVSGAGIRHSDGTRQAV